MSVVTGFTLICDIMDAEGPALIAINNWLKDRITDKLTDLSDKGDGGKHPQYALFSAGFNYFPDEAFIEFFKTIEWIWPASAVLVLHQEQPEDGAIVARPNGYGS